MLELELGFMTDEQMAEWCGKTINSYKKNRKRWSETKLIRYADFELKRGGIEIIKIKDPIYSASGKKEVKEKWRPYWGYNGSSIDTNLGCWRKLKSELTNQISDSTGRTYISQIKCEEYGVPYKNKLRAGTKGHCHFVFCKIVNGIPFLLTEEEEKIKDELEKKYLKDQAQQTYELQALLSIFKQGEISEEEYYNATMDVLETDYSWSEFQKQLEKALGHPTDFRVNLVDDIIKHIELNKNDKFDF